jgi:hypothetical protein
MITILRVFETPVLLHMFMLISEVNNFKITTYPDIQKSSTIHYTIFEVPSATFTPSEVRPLSLFFHFRHKMFKLQEKYGETTIFLSENNEKRGQGNTFT